MHVALLLSADIQAVHVSLDCASNVHKSLHQQVSISDANLNTEVVH